MKPHEAALQSLVRQWIAKGEIDYQVVERLLRDDDPICEAVAFHCQQAVEKYIKAVLVSKQAEFPKTHSIAQLLDILQEFSPSVSSALEETVTLTAFGVQVRYPGDVVEVSPSQARRMFKLVKKARRLLLRELDTFSTAGNA